MFFCMIFESRNTFITLVMKRCELPALFPDKLIFNGKCSNMSGIMLFFLIQSLCNPMNLMSFSDQKKLYIYTCII